MQPAIQDINVMQGDSRDYFFRVRDIVFDINLGDWTAGGYTDLTNWTGASQIRLPSAPLTTQNGEIVAPLAEWNVFVVNQITTRGGVLLRLPHTRTANLPPAAATMAAALLAPPNLVWDVQLMSPTQEINTFISGGIRVLPEVTRV